MKNPFLTGTSIYLRPLERTDAARMQPWLNDSEVTRTLATHRPMNLSDEEDFIERVRKSEHDVALGIALRSDDRLIGTVGLHRIDWRSRQSGFGIEIGEKSEWGKGHATEATRLMLGYAFETLNLNRVWLHVYEHNARALRAYEKAGFKREGVLRQDTFREGRSWDTIVMAMLREEWSATRPSLGA